MKRSSSVSIIGSSRINMNQNEPIATYQSTETQDRVYKAAINN